MPANKYVESSFWNFDALFQPQQHPARDAHDTFFLSEPATCKTFPQEYLERVKKVHSKGGYGSLGYVFLDLSSLFCLYFIILHESLDMGTIGRLKRPKK